jgi:hypothetical protein
MIGLLGRRARLGALALAAVVAVALVALAHAGSGGAANGLQGGPGPWAPETAHLRGRVAALHLPGQSDTAFHIHARLRIVVDGHLVPVPAQIGITPDGRFLAPLHTHDASGIVHIESVRPHPFTLGQLFTIWGVRFGDARLGGYVDRGAERVRVYVDGAPIAHPAAYILRAHDRIVVGYGPPGSFSTVDPTPFPPGL